jgi:cytosol alanyl aminopeptidase
MRRLVRPLVLTALAACCGAAFAAGADAPPLGKLPRWAEPESYALSFKVDPTQEAYSGTTTIKVKLSQASDHLWLHGHDLKVSKVTVTDAAGKAHQGKYTVAAEKEGVARIDFGGKLDPQELTLAIEFTAPLNKQLQGLYKVTHEGVPYAMTQMEPVSARYAFPGFDEPSFKTPFDLSLTIPAADVGIANTKQVKEEKAGEGWKTLTFSTTKPLPTYLVAFGVGPWDVVNGPVITPDQYRSNPLDLRGIAAKGEGHRMQHVLGETPAIIHTLEDYYGFGYPFDKLDLLAAPDFSAGAMENAGLVTFRDFLLLIDPTSPAQYVRGSFNVNAHELAHQWTGDTVTMPWWDDIWLNEAFATWMQQKVTEKVHPEYRADLDRLRGAQGAMNNDSLVSARKIRQPITGNGDIETAFDGITYQKGAAVLGMFEGYVTEPVFQKGMRAYIAKHKFSNATADDLVDAIAEAAGQGDTFKHAFKSFLDQSGVPYVTTEVKSEGGKTVLHLSQSRYLPVGSTGDAKRVWGVPVCVRYGTAGGSKVQCELLDKATGTIVLDGASTPTWVLPNADGRGYYRFGVTKADLASLSKVVGTLDDGEQIAYADAVSAGFKHGDLDAGDALAALKPLAASKTHEVSTAPMGLLTWIMENEAKTDAQRTHIADWAKQAYLPKLEQLGYRKKTGEPDSDAVTRAELADFLAEDMKVAEVHAELLKQGDAALKAKADGRLDLDAADPDLLGLSLAAAVEEHGKPAIDALIAEMPKTSDPQKRNAMLAGLAASGTNAAEADHVRDFALGKDVKVGEMAAILRGGRESQASRDGLWKWFTGNYDKVVARTGSFAGGRMPAMAGGGGCSKPEADRLTAFFKPRLKEVTGADRGLAQTTEQTLLCAALKAKQDPGAITR